MANKKQIDIIKVFDKYRVCKYLLNCGSGNNAHKSFCDTIDYLVESLPGTEQTLIKERYLSLEGDYLTDRLIYEEKLKMSAVTFIKARNKAFDILTTVLKAV